MLFLLAVLWMGAKGGRPGGLGSQEGPLRLACSRSQVSPGRSGTPATFALTRAAVLEDALPVTERLAVFRTRRGPKWAGWQAASATCRPPDSINTVSSPCYHIVESWDIEKMMEETLPTPITRPWRRTSGIGTRRLAHTCWTILCPLKLS